MTPDLHPELDDLILFTLGRPSGTPASKEDAAAIERVRLHVQHCQECKSEAEQLRSDFALVAMALPQMPPPAGAKERLIRAAGVTLNTNKSASIKPFPKPLRDGSDGQSIAAVRARRTNPFLVWGGWVAAIACLVYAIHVRDMNLNMEHRLEIETAQINQTNAAAARNREVVEILTSPESQRVTLVSAHTLPVPSGDAVYLRERGGLVFTASHMVPLPPNKTYQLWVIPANGTAPVPAGTFQPDAHGMASVLLPNLPKGIEAKAFGVTMEKAGGATTPTLPILLAGG
jgi:hypothetical protein